jgi:hypothetical protein
VQAILLAGGVDNMRIVVPGEEDTRTLQFVNGAWISEEGEPVTVEFEWQRQKRTSVPVEADCICSKELADELMQMSYSPDHAFLPDQPLRLIEESIAVGSSGRQFWIS